MSQGIQLLSAICAARSHTAARMLRPELFTADERPAFEFVHGFYRRYGQLPTAEAAVENGLRFMPAPQPVPYYFDRVAKRNIGSAWTEKHKELVAALGRADVPAGQAVLEEMVRIGRRFQPQNNTVVSLVDAMELVREDYQAATALDGALRGVTFGWDFVDGITGGATRGDVTVFVARPGMGKSWTMIYNALAAWRSGHSVLFMTMEMTVVQTARRMLGMMCGINPNLIKQGRLSDWADHLLHEYIDDGLYGPPFHFVSGDLNKSVADLDNLVAEFSPDLVVVDAAYLLDASNTSGKFAKYAKHEALQDVLKGLKDLALSRDVPVNISVQFNREAGKTKGSLDNIGGSDWIGQIASNVFGIAPGEGSNAKTQRIYEILKARDSESGARFVTNFLFQPFDMSFIAELREDAANQNTEMAALNSSMI